MDLFDKLDYAILRGIFQKIVELVHKYLHRSNVWLARMCTWAQIVLLTAITLYYRDSTLLVLAWGPGVLCFMLVGVLEKVEVNLRKRPDMHAKSAQQFEGVRQGMLGVTPILTGLALWIDVEPPRTYLLFMTVGMWFTVASMYFMSCAPRPR